MEQYDLIVIGGGMAGLPLSQKAALKGRKTALVEMELLGGTCLNRGCIPTKTMIHSAKIMHHVRRAAEFGIVGAFRGFEAMLVAKVVAIKT